MARRENLIILPVFEIFFLWDDFFGLFFFTVILIGKGECTVQSTLAAFAHYHPFIKKSGDALCSFISLTLPGSEASVAAFASGPLLAEHLPVFAREGEQAPQVSASGAFPPENAFEIPFLRAGVMFNSYFESGSTAGFASI